MNDQSVISDHSTSTSIDNGPEDWVRDTMNYWARAYESRTSRIPDEKLASDAAAMHLRRTWEVEVEAMSIQLSAAKSRLNAFCSVYKLPSELLGYIFEFLAAVSPVGGRGRRWGWVNVTHVNRRFRDVALASASLWSSLSIDGDTPWNIFLPRSRQAPLTIYGDATKATTPYFPHLLRNVERIQAIYVDEITSLPSPDHSWLSITRETVPELRSLTLEMSQVDMDSGKFDCTLDQQFLLQGSPKLQHLELAGIRIPWTLPSPLNLLSLSLTSWNLFDKWDYSVQDVFRFLQDSVPALQYLRLWEAIPSVRIEIPQTPITLPSLRMFWLIDFHGDSRCIDLWASLSLPPTCSVYIETDSLDGMGEEEDEDQAIQDLVKLVKEHLARQGCPVYRYICIGNSNADDPEQDADIIRFSARSTESALGHWMQHRQSLHGPRSTEDPMLSFELRSFHPGDTLCGLLELFPSEPVRTLALTSWLPTRHIPFKTLFTTLLRYFPFISTLEIRVTSNGLMDDDLGRDFCRYLLDGLAPSTGGVLNLDNACYMPHLHTLVLHNFEFCGRMRGRRLYDNLSEAFRRRHASSIPARAIKIYNSDVKDSWFEPWLSYVDEVWCDPATCRTVKEDWNHDDGEDGEGGDDDE
ncbi:hypothetical protein PENSPDRAFT_736148 [Peniophora sp. CONT]|nr:hypothetical protein PENSPDRAFT_736148 [Peniophora sp. CONT]